MRAAALASLLVVAGCGASQHGISSRPIDEDPMALLPSGADLVADIDVEQLRRWTPGRRFLGILPDAARARIEQLGFDPLNDVDALFVAVSQLGTPNVASTLIVKGEIDLSRARAGLGPVADVLEADYRENKIFEGPAGAMARITPHLVVFASRVDVRRVIDLARGDGESLRRSAQDGPLLKALERAPTAKQGRPAVMAACVPSEPLREALRKESLPGSDFEWLALSLAVGDGFDVAGAVGLPGPAEATAVVNAAKQQLADFSGRMAVRLLGLKPFLDPIVMVAREEQMKFAYRLGAPPVERMLAKLEAVQAMGQKARRSTLNE